MTEKTDGLLTVFTALAGGMVGLAPIIAHEQGLLTPESVVMVQLGAVVTLLAMLYAEVAL